MLATIVTDDELVEKEKGLQDIIHEYYQEVWKGHAKKKEKDASKNTEDQSSQTLSASSEDTPTQGPGHTFTNSASKTADKAPAIDLLPKPKETRQYKHAASIVTEGTTEDIVKRLLDAKIMLTMGEVFSESTAVCSWIKEVLTNQKVSIMFVLKESEPAAVGKDAFVFIILKQ